MLLTKKLYVIGGSGDSDSLLCLDVSRCPKTFSASSAAAMVWSEVHLEGAAAKSLGGSDTEDLDYF